MSRYGQASARFCGGSPPRPLRLCVRLDRGRLRKGSHAEARRTRSGELLPPSRLLGASRVGEGIGRWQLVGYAFDAVFEEHEAEVDQ